MMPRFDGSPRNGDSRVAEPALAWTLAPRSWRTERKRVARPIELPSTAPQTRDEHLAVTVRKGSRPGHTLCGGRRDLAAGCNAARRCQIAVHLARTGKGQAYDLPVGINGTCDQQ